MPEVVQSYVTNQSYKETYMIQKRLVNDYYNDMAKYAQGSERIKVRECYQSLPAQLAKDNKKFQYKLVKKGAGSRHYEASLQWLVDSHMIIKTFKLDNTQFPIEASVDQSSFKVYLSDTGMLVSLFGEEIIQSILMDNPTIKGVFYENSIIQLIKAYHKSAYYYEPNQYSEIDFIIKHEGQLCPIEVKSSHHTESRSFKHFVQKLKPKLSLRLSTKNIGYDADLNIYYLPHYLFEFFLISEKPLL
jgi:predicted AAA+ superfamily ATPase